MHHTEYAPRLLILMIISAVALVLSTAVLLASGEKRSRPGERVSHDFELSGLRDLETCSLANRAMEDPNKVRSDPDQIAQRITTLAQRCLEYIDDLKNEYVSMCCST